jgi:hypothetical protein
MEKEEQKGKRKENVIFVFWNYILLTTVSKNPKARRANKALSGQFSGKVMA